jgi:hypothetical protein
MMAVVRLAILCAIGLLLLCVGPAAAQQRSLPRRIQTEHLDISTYTTADTMTAGSVMSIVLEITPHDRIHVYAPGATGYKIITLKVNDHPLLTAGPLQYGPSETYLFKPLNERVQVFQKPFTLKQPMSFRASDQAIAAAGRTGTVTINAQLEYQACNDTICFLPKSVPIAYTLKVSRRLRLH